MAEGEEGTITFAKSVCVTVHSDSSEMSLDERETNGTTIDDKRRLELRNFTGRIQSSLFRRGCSEACTEYIGNGSASAQMSSYKPQALSESTSRQRKLETKKSAGSPLSDQRPKTKIKGTSKKLQISLPFFEKATKSTLAKMKSLYEDLRARRALGFKCDMRKCNSTLMECSVRACKEEGMLFGGRAQPEYDSERLNSSTSDSSTISSTSKRDRGF